MNPALDRLLRSQPALWRGRDRHNDLDAIATGFDTLDASLPSHGWGIGVVTELLVTTEGIGEFSLLLPALQHITSTGQWVALVNPPHIPYAPALSNAGLRLDRLLIIDSSRATPRQIAPGDDRDTLWAAEQILRTGTFTAVIAWVGHTTVQRQRRLQLAAETGKCCAFVYRPANAADEHSPAALRIRLQSANSRLQLDIIKSRGGRPRSVSLHPAEFDRPQGVAWPIASAAIPCSGASLSCPTVHCNGR